MSKKQKENTLMITISIIAILVWVLVACNKQNFKDLQSIPQLEPANQDIEKQNWSLFF